MTSNQHVSRLRSNLVRVFSVVYLIVGFSWLLAPILNHRLVTGPNLVSEYEAIGMPYWLWFKLADVISALALISAVYIASKSIKSRYGGWILAALTSIGILSLVDVFTPPACVLAQRVCTPRFSLILVIHFIESLLLGLIIFLLGIAVSIKERRYWWGPLLQIVFGIVGFVASHYFDHGLFGLQALTIIVETFWLWRVFFSPYFTIASPQDIGLVRRSLAVLVALVGLLSILGSYRHFVTGGFTTNVWFGPATAWLAQHSIAVGFAFLYLARQIYQGDITAYKITLWLVLLQVIKYSAVIPRFLPLSIYSTILIILIFSQDYFVRHTSPKRFLIRARSALIAAAVSILIIILFGSLFKIREPDIWERSAYNATRVVMRVTLLEFRSNPHDTLHAKLFGQALNTLGIAMYAWILSGLFLPALYSKHHANDAERELMQDLLKQYGASSEDSFKLWPPDKQYWINHNDTAAVAYKQSKGFVFALESPVGSPNSRRRALIAFRNYCRQQGWKVVWLMAQESAVSLHEKAGLKTMTIGASAVVDLEKYANTTVRDKWWRWIRNKNIKLGLTYERLEAPYDEATLKRLGYISDSWLSSDGHEERTFALGYYDESFMKQCVLHILRDQNGEIVSFANQLPTYHGNTRATIDLMRSLPEYDGAVSYLLSEAMLSLHQIGRFKTFDLGFVPLAQTEEKTAKKVVISFTQSLLQTFFSARGLRQFKNKFDPIWHDNYLAWDGDWFDLPAIAQALDKVLTPETDTPA